MADYQCQTFQSNMDLEQGELGTAPFCLGVPQMSISPMMEIFLVEEAERERDAGMGRTGNSWGPGLNLFPEGAWGTVTPPASLGGPEPRSVGPGHQSPRSGSCPVYTHVSIYAHMSTLMHTQSCTNTMFVHAHVYVYLHTPTHTYMGMSWHTPIYACTQGPSSDHS